MAVSRSKPTPWIVLVAVAVVAAGCTDKPAESAGGTATPDATTDPENATSNATDALAELEPPAARTMFLSADRSLVDTIPAAGSLPGSEQGNQCLTASDCQPLEFLSAALQRDYLIAAEQVTFTFWVQATTPIAGGTPFDVLAWFGSTLAVPAYGQYALPAPIAPGTPTKLEYAWSFGSIRPVALPQGESFRLIVGIAPAYEGTSSVQLLTGGDTPSAISFTGANATFVPVAATPTETRFSGALGHPGTGQALPTDQASPSVVAHEFVVGPTTTRLEVHLLRTGAAPGPADIDVDLLLGDESISGGHTPRGEERMHLQGAGMEGLAGQTLVARVSSFSASQATYELVVLES